MDIKINEELITTAIASSNGYVAQSCGKLTVDQSLTSVLRVVVAESVTDDLRSDLNRDNLMYLVMSSDGSKGKYYYPDRYFENRPYEGRPFIHGVFDCYSLINDWYAREKGVYLPWNIERSHGWWNSENLYIENIGTVGFSETHVLKSGVILLSALAGNKLNHASIYLGDGNILHHVGGRFSCIEKMTAAMFGKIGRAYEYCGDVK